MDFYRYLLDIQSLDLVIKRHLDQTQEELKRIDFLQKQKQKRIDENDEMINKKTDLKDQLTALEKKLFTLEDKISKSKSHMEQANSESQINALNKEVETLTPQIDEVENEILATLDKVEQCEQYVEDNKEYFSGIEDTIKDIQTEVTKIENENKEKIDALELQISGLIKEIPESFLSTYSRIREKFRFQTPIVQLTGTACSVCRMQISSGEATEVNNSYQHRICSGCGRLIISNNVK
ncbi:MAG: hypothetical protein BM556_17000 [Bacteriovorax sp. MedPE-SWde]|nr:MAG: hypothetical protein BM556_17000 [Bacteriovorax sp. MedPE-SWde]